MIRAGAVWALQQSAVLLVALAAPVVAFAMVGDLFAAPARSDLALATQIEYVARIAPLARVAPMARGERLMTFDVAVDLVRVTTPAPSDDLASELIAAAALAPGAETAPGPEPGPAVAPEPTAAPTAQPRPIPTPQPAPPALNTSPATRQAELDMLGLMNASRLQAGLVPLALDAVVSAAARQHSAVEAQYRYVYHDGPDGTARSRYVPACGNGWYGENTGKVWGGGVEVLHLEFMAEPWVPINHRTNIMDPNFRRAGIGAVQGPDALYISIAFCR